MWTPSVVLERAGCLRSIAGGAALSTTQYQVLFLRNWPQLTIRREGTTCIIM